MSFPRSPAVYAAGSIGLLLALPVLAAICLPDRIPRTDSNPQSEIRNPQSAAPVL